MTRRRDQLKALFGGADAPAPEAKGLAAPPAPPPSSSPSSPPPPPARAASGALKAMGLELDHLRADAAEAERLRAALAAGEQVVELDPALVDDAFLRDRMPGDPAADAALRDSIAANGQQVPILVRPRRDAPGRYEAVYGHRRLAAARALGVPVRAVVRRMDDEALLIAQGQENNARRDLTFIERARFAGALEARGFSRQTAMAALGVHPADMTRYLAVANALNGRLIEAIGPAPAAGRARWQALADALAARGEGRRLPPEIERLIADPAFREMPSDARFKAVFAAATGAAAQPPSPAEPPRRLGPLAVHEALKPMEARLTFAGPGAEAFARYLLARLDALHAAHAAETRPDAAPPTRNP